MNTQKEFQQSITINDVERVNQLLKNKEVDPSFNDNCSFEIAAKNGYTEIVEILLKDGRADPNDENYPIGLAAERGDTDIVQLFLNDSRVDPHDFNNYAIRSAIHKKYKNIINLLWNDKRVKNSLKIELPELYDLLTKEELQKKVREF